MNTVTVTCATCGKSIQKYPSLVKPHSFCCDACYRAYRKTLTGDKSHAWKGGLTTRTCQHCHKSFQVISATQYRTRFCSNFCKYASRRKIGHCLICGLPFPPTRPGRKFCSYACYQVFRASHPRQASSETKVKISVANLGSIGLSGSDNPMYKDGRCVIKTRDCPQCGKQFTAPAFQKCCSRACAGKALTIKLSNFYHDTPEGQSLRERYRTEMQLLGNPEWAHEEYAPGFTHSLKRRVLHRDGHKCRICGSPSIEKRWLAIHHIDGAKSDHSLDNLITLCKPCHMRTHRTGTTLSV